MSNYRDMLLADYFNEDPDYLLLEAIKTEASLKKKIAAAEAKMKKSKGSNQRAYYKQQADDLRAELKANRDIYQAQQKYGVTFADKQGYENYMKNQAPGIDARKTNDRNRRIEQMNTGLGSNAIQKKISAYAKSHGVSEEKAKAELMKDPAFRAAASSKGNDILAQQGKARKEQEKFNKNMAAYQAQGKKSGMADAIKAKMTKKNLATVGAGAVGAGGAAVGVTSAVKLAKLKKNAKELYAEYRKSGGSESFDEWYKKKKAALIAGTVGGAAVAGAGATGAVLAQKKLNEAYDIAYIESFYDTIEALEALDEDYDSLDEDYDSYDDDDYGFLDDDYDDLF